MLESDVATAKADIESVKSHYIKLVEIKDHKVSITHNELSEIRDMADRLSKETEFINQNLTDITSGIRSMTFGDRLTFLFTNKTNF